ncbi:MAG: winged helix-turn-helix domain-containing protein [Pseudobdellovibrionaceae bacterium]
MRVFAYLQDSDLVEEITDVLDALPETYEVEYASGESDLLSLIQHHDYDLILLGIDGARTYPFTTLELLKNRSLKGPVICLHVNGKANTLFNALSHGAQVALPFTPESFPKNTLEMLLNNAYLTANGVNKNIVVGALKMDLDAKTVQVNAHPLDLTFYEYKTLEALLMHVDKSMSRDKVLQHVYGYRSEDLVGNTVEVFITRIRKKLNLAQEGLGDRLTTVRGHGYLFTSEEAAEPKPEPEVKPQGSFTAQLPVRTRAPQPRPAIARQHFPSPKAMAPVSAWRTEDTLELTPLKLNTALQKAAIADKPIHLAPQEFKILHTLFLRHPKPLSVYDLAEQMMGDATKTASAYVALGKLRQKMSEAGADEDIIMNINRVGYRIRTSSEDAAEITEQYKPQKTSAAAPKAKTFFAKQATLPKEVVLEDFGPWSFNREEKILRYKGISIPANDAEFSFIEQLIDAYPKIVARETLARTLYGGKIGSLNTRISLFRKKLDDCGLTQIPFSNIHGVGFKLDMKAGELSKDQSQPVVKAATEFRASSSLPRTPIRPIPSGTAQNLSVERAEKPKPKRLPTAAPSAFQGEGAFTSGALEINADTGLVTYEDAVLEHVIGKNIDLLILLTKNHGQAVTFEKLAEHLLGDGSQDNQKRIQMGVSSLRHQINKSVWGLGDSLISDIGSFGVTLVTGESDLQNVRHDNRERLQEERAARREAANSNGGDKAQTASKAPAQPAITVNGKPLHSTQKRAAHGGVSPAKKDGPQSANDRFRQRYGNFGLQ